MAWVYESYRMNLNRYTSLLNGILQIIYPEFFRTLSVEKFDLKKPGSGARREIRNNSKLSCEPIEG
jgi:hypothetical protein